MSPKGKCKLYFTNRRRDATDIIQTFYLSRNGTTRPALYLPRRISSCIRDLLATGLSCHLQQLRSPRRMPDPAPQHQHPSQQEQATSLVCRCQRRGDKVEQSRDTKTNLHHSKCDDSMDALLCGGWKEFLHGW